MSGNREENPLPEKQHVIHVEALAAAREVADEETPIWRILLRNPRVIACCCFANIGGIMYGFDNLALSLCLSMEPFQRQFGQQSATGYIIPAYWQSLWNALAQVATMLGSLAAGQLCDMFGRRAGFLVASVISFAGIAVVYVSSSPGVFLAGKMVNGVALGMAIAAAQTYIAEISPVRIRGLLLAIYTFSINLGFLLAASVAFDRVSITTDSGYKVLFASEWAWPAVMFILVWFLPESPYHLVRKDKLEAASRSLQKLHSSSANIVALTHEIESLIADEKASAASNQDATYLECFRGDNWRRTRIILYANGLNQLIGTTFLSNGPYFLISAGMSPSRTAMMIELGNGIGIIGNVATWIGMSFLGRRVLTLAGLALSAVLYLVVGVAGCFPDKSSALWVVGIVMQVMWFVLGPCIGPSMAVAAEVSTARLRSKSQSIGFMFNYFFSTVWNVVVPYMYNTDEGNLGGKVGFIFLATSIMGLLLVFLELPETKDKTFAEIDALFAQGVPTRKFGETKADEVVATVD